LAREKGLCPKNGQCRPCLREPRIPCVDVQAGCLLLHAYLGLKIWIKCANIWGDGCSVRSSSPSVSISQCVRKWRFTMDTGTLGQSCLDIARSPRLTQQYSEGKDVFNSWRISFSRKIACHHASDKTTSRTVLGYAQLPLRKLGCFGRAVCIMHEALFFSP